ncbi:YidC/Oxa1 family membrane protein insertase [Candidatus Saccharibacteria bacterium]|nr:YidC/Oxa1 family membrane protein insertase [Candidatus Saccharibacteria bacterium]
MFTTFVVQPIFNLLVLIYALIPGHNFGLAIILFTILIRILMLPLIRKQLHHAKAIRQLQPELKKIKLSTKGDRQKQSQMTMELYKERQINPFASLGVVLVQIPILIGLYYAVKRIVENPQQIVDFSYSFISNISWLKTLATDINMFDETLLGVIDLTRKAVGEGGVYWPAMLLVIGSAGAQFLQSRQLMPKSEDARPLKKILSEAGKGKTADQTEVNAAVGRATLYLIPGFVFIISLNFPSALPLYWFTGSTIAFLQQRRILKEDVSEAEAVAAVSEPDPVTKKQKAKARKNAKNSRSKGRRKK